MFNGQADGHKGRPRRIVVEGIEKAPVSQADVENNGKGHRLHDPQLQLSAAYKQADLSFHLQPLLQQRSGLLHDLDHVSAASGCDQEHLGKVPDLRDPGPGGKVLQQLGQGNAVVQASCNKGQFPGHLRSAAEAEGHVLRRFPEGVLRGITCPQARNDPGKGFPEFLRQHVLSFLLRPVLQNFDDRNTKGQEGCHGKPGPVKKKGCHPRQGKSRQQMPGRYPKEGGSPPLPAYAC